MNRAVSSLGSRASIRHPSAAVRGQDKPGPSPAGLIDTVRCAAAQSTGFGDDDPGTGETPNTVWLSSVATGWGGRFGRLPYSSEPTAKPSDPVREAVTSPY